jgi:hypothetical protein
MQAGMIGKEKGVVNGTLLSTAHVVCLPGSASLVTPFPNHASKARRALWQFTDRTATGRGTTALEAQSMVGRTSCPRDEQPEMVDMRLDGDVG